MILVFILLTFSTCSISSRVAAMVFTSTGWYYTMMCTNSSEFSTSFIHRCLNMATSSIILCNCAENYIIGGHTASCVKGSMNTAGTTLRMDWISSTSMSVYTTTDRNLYPAVLSSISSLRVDFLCTPSLICRSQVVEFIPITVTM